MASGVVSMNCSNNIYVNEKTGETYPFMPLPLTGEIIHDIGRKKDINDWELEACHRDLCRCDDRPTGWRLTRPIVRAMLSVTDSFLNDHGRELPGLIGSSWALAYDTLTFMKELYFNPEFTLPTRAASRAAIIVAAKTSENPRSARSTTGPFCWWNEA